MFRRAWIASAALVLGLTAVALASPSDRWLHVRVIESGEDGEQVNINLPLPLAESVLQSIDSHSIHGGRIDIHLHDSDIDLPALRAALLQAQDGEYITVRDGDENVRVAKENGRLHIRSEERGEKVDVRLDLSVLDALLGSGTDELDVRAALHVLGQQQGITELVRVDSDDESVRIWLDDQPDQE